MKDSKSPYDRKRVFKINLKQTNLAHSNTGEQEEMEDRPMKEFIDRLTILEAETRQKETYIKDLYDHKFIFLEAS